jgi:hypothetical protein
MKAMLLRHPRSPLEPADLPTPVPGALVRDAEYPDQHGLG